MNTALFPGAFGGRRAWTAVMALCMIMTAHSDIRASESASRVRDVWIVDAMLDMLFCRIRVPAGWRVEGNVAWTYARPVMSPSVWIRLVDPGTGRVFESIGPIGSFHWLESSWTPSEPKDDSRNPKHGRFSMEENAYFLRPRSGVALLTEFIRPLVAKVTPEAEILWIRDGHPVAGHSGTDSENGGGLPREEQRAMVGGLPDVVSEAGMLVERNGVRSLLATTVSAWDAKPELTDVTALRWEWNGVSITTAPSGSGDPVGDAVFRDRIVLNPEWLRQAGELVQKQRNDFHPDNTWPLIDFGKYYAQAWESGEIVEQAADSSMTDAAGSRYVDPAPGAPVHIPRATRGYANAVVAALVLGESPYGSGIASLERFE